jgi:hypothetical protein
MLGDNDIGPDLIAREAPADPASLSKLRTTAPLKLPAAYLRLLATANGLEGDLAMQPWWIQLWSAEEVLSMNELYQVHEFHPGFFGIGSSGGGVMFALAIAEGDASQVYGVPFDSTSPEDVVVVAATVDAFAQAVGRWQDAV